MKAAAIVILAKVAIAERCRNHMRDLPFHSRDGLVSRIVSNARIGIAEERPFFPDRYIGTYTDDRIPPTLGGVHIALATRKQRCGRRSGERQVKVHMGVACPADDIQPD